MSNHDKRIRAYTHNALMGHAAMMVSQCNGIMNSSTATEEAKATAAHIQRLALLLREQLKTRKD